jgi:hypothetical protein
MVSKTSKMNLEQKYFSFLIVFRIIRWINEYNENLFSLNISCASPGDNFLYTTVLIVTVLIVETGNGNDKELEYEFYSQDFERF